VNNTTLLHFLERTVAKNFPEMEEFLEELAAPAEAYRGTCRRSCNALILTALTSQSSRGSQRLDGPPRRHGEDSTGAN
jgi:hypothetical protein